MKPSKPVVVFLLKLVVSAGLLTYFLSHVDLGSFVRIFKSADFSYIVLALGVYFVSQGASAVRWTVLARPLGIRTPFMDMARYYLIGMFFNLFAPSTVGGDVSRIYYLVRDEEAQAEGRSVAAVHAALSVLVDRVIGMAVLVWLGAAGVLLFSQYPVPSAVRKATLLVASALAAAALLTPLLRRVLPEDGHQLAVKLRLALRSFRLQPRALIDGVALSLLIHLVQAGMHVALGRALGIDLPFSFCIIVYPIVGTFAAIPISVSGLGLREGGYLYLLSVIGVGKETGIAFGLLLFLIVAVNSLVGGVVFLLRRGYKPVAAL